MDYPQSTEYEPIEPTKPVAYPYSLMSYLDNPYIIAPPPPPPKKQRKYSLFVVAVLVVSLVLFGGSLLFYLASTHQESIARVVVATPVPIIVLPTPVPTVQPYTAQAILSDIISHNLTVVSPAYGESLSYFFSESSYITPDNTAFQSSVIWSVYPGQTPGYCPDACLGLWVYTTKDIASSVNDELNAQSAVLQSTPSQGPTIYPNLSEYGRCVAQGMKGTTYEAIIKQYCL